MKLTVHASGRTHSRSPTDGRDGCDVAGGERGRWIRTRFPPVGGRLDGDGAAGGVDRPVDEPQPEPRAVDHVVHLVDAPEHVRLHGRDGRVAPPSTLTVMPSSSASTTTRTPGSGSRLWTTAFSISSATAEPTSASTVASPASTAAVAVTSSVAAG